MGHNESNLRMAQSHGMQVDRVVGSRPKLGRPFFRMLRTGEVSADFEFTFTASTKLGFTGFARKSAGPA